YDCLFLVNNGKNMKFKRPNIPILMYGHDCWPVTNKGFQWVIDWVQPDIFLSSCLSCWQDYYKFPAKTKFVFYPFFDSLFFARPNLNEKKFDLLIIGAQTAALYNPRIILNRQLEEFSKKHADYQIELSKLAGSGNVFRGGGVVKEDAETGLEMCFLNKWSEYLGSSKYVIFGRTEYPFVTGKHYETLGSGAIPIFPEVPDLKYLGIEPFKHYIPLSEVEGNNEKLAYYLDNYGKYRFIAENAVKWYKENSDRLIFNNFEDTIREITNYKYPKRLI
ncbi:MAG: hypothetical protein Q7R46_02130, partial [bacterium]|nr:hypothetical protein [bacterium]